MDCLQTNLGRQQSSALGGEGHPNPSPAVPSCMDSPIWEADGAEPLLQHSPGGEQ